jgi:hypothetical protein
MKELPARMLRELKRKNLKESGSFSRSPSDNSGQAGLISARVKKSEAE